MIERVRVNRSLKHRARRRLPLEGRTAYTTRSTRGATSAVGPHGAPVALVRAVPPHGQGTARALVPRPKKPRVLT